MRREDKIMAGQHPRGTRVSGWTQDPGAAHCCFVYVEGGNPDNVVDRVAFIEKSPRVRVKSALPDGVDPPGAWRYGHKGSGGSGDAQAQGIYGFDARSRQWCERQLKRMGYVMPRRVRERSEGSAS